VFSQDDKFWSTRYLIAQIYLTQRVGFPWQTWPPALVEETDKRKTESNATAQPRVKCRSTVFGLAAA
jgi:hypothetical protein